MKTSKLNASPLSLSPYIPLTIAIFFALGYLTPEALLSHYLIPQEQDKAALILVQLLIVLFLVAVTLKISEIFESRVSGTHEVRQGKETATNFAVATLWAFFWGLSYLPIAFTFLLSATWLCWSSGAVTLIVGVSVAVGLSAASSKLADSVARNLSICIVEFITTQLGGF